MWGEKAMNIKIMEAHVGLVLIGEIYIPKSTLALYNKNARITQALIV